MSTRHNVSLSPDATARWQSLARRAEWDAGRAAELLGLSLRQLERLSQRDLNCTPSEWLQRERMAAAAQLLGAGQPVKLVAAYLGYSLPANFSRDFKRYHGRTPRTFAPPRLMVGQFGGGKPAAPPGKVAS